MLQEEDIAGIPKDPTTLHDYVNTSAEFTLCLTEPFSSPALFSAIVCCGVIPTSEVDEALLIWAKTLASPKAVARIHRTGKSIGRMGRTPFT